MMDAGAPAVGQLLRDWRTRRRLSQLDLSSAAGISSRHLSFVETGRSRPSREMVLHLADQLDVPLRDRNALLIAGGFAPTFRATDFHAPEMEPVREAVDRLLAAHEPYPAILVDRQWTLMAANRAAIVLVDGVAPELLEAPCNVLRATLHPAGLSSRIRNLDEWFDHILGNLRRQVAVTGDDGLRALTDELMGYADELGVVVPPPHEGFRAIALPMRLRTDDGELAFITMLATFGTALDITLTELTIETFLPADAPTAAALQRRFGLLTA
jgi:transcriptional regulator with XRE-family HTH domain